LKDSTHLDEFRRKLEGRAFEAQVPRRVGQDEAVVDVDEMAVIVKQNVSIVAIFHLKYKEIIFLILKGIYLNVKLNFNPKIRGKDIYLNVLGMKVTIPKAIYLGNLLSFAALIQCSLTFVLTSSKTWGILEG